MCAFVRTPTLTETCDRVSDTGHACTIYADNQDGRYRGWSLPGRSFEAADGREGRKLQVFMIEPGHPNSDSSVAFAETKKAQFQRNWVEKELFADQRFTSRA